MTTEVEGSFGTLAFAGLWNSVEVRSPTVARRQADTFGTSTPNRSLTSLSCEVWSNTSEAMWPPRPRPSGPAMLSVPGAGSPIVGGDAVRYSPAVPGGAVGGGTWSNHPSFSSYMRKSAVFDHTLGFAVRASSTSEVNHIPLAGADEGCSSKPSGGMSHDTLGSDPDLTSPTKSFGNVGVNAFWSSDESGWRPLHSGRGHTNRSPRRRTNRRCRMNRIQHRNSNPPSRNSKCHSSN